MRDYDFAQFVKSIEDSSFFEAAAKSDAEIRVAESDAKRESRKKRSIDRDSRPARYRDQIGGLLFWFHSCQKANGLTNSEFLLIEPLCQKLVSKGQLKKEALDVFEGVKKKLAQEGAL